MTRHLAAFLTRQAQALASSQDAPVNVGGKSFVHPTAVLFNGGVFKAAPLKARVLEVLNGWLTADGGQPAQELEGADLDLAVARGAAYYGWVRQGHGLRIRGGTARAYYVGVETAMPAVPGMEPPVKALCVAPFGMEEGTQADVPPQEFGLVVGEPTRFRFFASSVRRDDKVGELVDDVDGQRRARGARPDRDHAAGHARGRRGPRRRSTCRPRSPRSARWSCAAWRRTAPAVEARAQRAHEGVEEPARPGRAARTPMHIVGIDLGTTHCAVASVDPSQGASAPVEDFPVPQLVRPGRGGRARRCCPRASTCPRATSSPPGRSRCPGASAARRWSASSPAGRARGFRAGWSRPRRAGCATRAWTARPPILPWGAPADVAEALAGGRAAPCSSRTWPQAWNARAPRGAARRSRRSSSPCPPRSTRRRARSR